MESMDQRRHHPVMQSTEPKETAQSSTIDNAVLAVGWIAIAQLEAGNQPWSLRSHG